MAFRRIGASLTMGRGRRVHTKFNRAGGKNKRGGARSDAGRPKKEEAEAAKSDVDMFDDAEHAEHGEGDEDADLSRRLPFFFVFAVFIEVTCGSGINPPPVAINKKNCTAVYGQIN